ncbi:MAG: ribonucleoside triphosphate reductase [Epsilonproteobacteria bacterium]|nr:MAG: ribonucleoside triphosphate reductase [Campylobacterota bacterium]RLA67684.1 MAG: ribonucleoside triphosphate reductase [Campylobacterota bacterium]
MTKIYSMVGESKRILKRNNQVALFDRAKIESAIFKALDSIGKSDKLLAKTLSTKVEGELWKDRHLRTIPAVEEVQDIVEKILMSEGELEAAKSYILYRDQQRKIRKGKEFLLDIEKTMDGYLKKSDWRVQENSNVNFSLGGLILHNSGAVTANYWLNHIYPPEVSKAHTEGDYHIHDLSMFSGYCAGWSLRQLLLEGISGVKNKVNSKPAKHLSSVISQMVNFLGIMQNEWAGAQAFSSFDTYLAPFVRVDKLDEKTVKQAVQSFIFNMNTPSRWGSQAPFTNITLDWTVPKDLKKQKAIVGGVELDFCYEDCQEEMDVINKVFLEVMLEGDADGRGFSYPIPTYNITRDFNWASANAELLFKMTAQFGTPYFQNFINSNLDPSDVRSMCCRLQLDKRELRNRGGGLFGADEFTGSIGVVTINLPRIGFVAKSKEEVFSQLDKLMNLAKESLEIKRKLIDTLMAQGLFPYSKRFLKNLDNHFSTIGLNGMNECCLNFLGASIDESRGKEFAEEILEFMRKKLSDYQEETGNLFNLEATPAEGASYRLALKDQERFPGIIQSGDDEKFYTNSTHLPVDYTKDIFQALEHQDSLQTKYTGGTVFHGFLGEDIKDWKTAQALVKKVAYNFHLPYFTITPTFSICQDHGRISGEHFNCPDCGKESEVYSRVVGYYRPVQNWNKGKKSEFKERQEYVIDAASGENHPSTFTFFYTDNCPRCPAVKENIKNLNIKGIYVDAESEMGQNMAQELKIKTVPTIVFYDENKKLVGRAHTVEEINNCL